MTWLPGLFPILAGFGLWSAGFVALYGLQALGCAYGWNGEFIGIGLHRLVLTVTYTVVVAGGALLVWVSWRGASRTAGPRQMIEWVGFTLNLAALGASVFVFTAIFGTSACI